MSEFDPPPNDDKANRFDGASVPRSHTQAASSNGAFPDESSRASGDLGCSEAVRDVSIEALLYRLDEALAAIRSLDAETPGGDSLASDESVSPDEP